MEIFSLMNQINQKYQLNVSQIELHRDLIGRVYLLHSGSNRNRKYVFKLYRSFKTDDALQTIHILDFLNANSYPAVSVLKTINNDSYIVLDCPEGRCTGILYDFVEGTTPDGKLEAKEIGEQIGELHCLMETYPGKLINRTKMDYIDDFISILSEKGFDNRRIADLQQYGNELWERITKLLRCFCHGDLHTGNMIKAQAGQYIIFDLDDASGDYPSMDVAYMSDDTNFNHFHGDMYDKTLHLFDRFYSGYSKVRTLSDSECKSIFDFIAIRHFQIIARIVRCQGLASISEEFCCEQHDWLMRWRELCAKKQ